MVLSELPCSDSWIWPTPQTVFEAHMMQKWTIRILLFSLLRFDILELQFNTMSLIEPFSTPGSGLPSFLHIA